jgi:hypothetical protein
MPFKSKAQMRYMFARHPKIAKKWAHKYGIKKSLPAKVKRSTKSSHKIIIRGKSAYVKRMFKHLRKEHPSTRRRMTIK